MAKARLPHQSSTVQYVRWEEIRGGILGVRRGVRFAAILALSMTLVSACSGERPTDCPPSRFRTSPPLVIAHASSDYFGPANTIEMMRAAVAAGADVVDADVRVTSDGYLVAAHDDDLTGMLGYTKLVSKSTLAELKTLDFGLAWAGPTGDYPLRGQQVRISTIEEILGAFPDRLVSLEFKVPGGEKSLCSLLRRLDRTDQVYVGSAGDAAVDAFRPICREVVTTVTDKMVVEMQAARANSDDQWCASVPIGQPPYVNNGEILVTRESVDWNHAHGLAVFTWTIDDPETLAAVRDAGVDGVYTGRADLAREIFSAGE